jgi:hypothetical protein
MSFVRLLAEGAGEAARLAPLVFTLGIAPAAYAQLPRAVPMQAEAGLAPALQTVTGASTPRLVSQHVAVTLSDNGSQLRTTSVFRNDGDRPISARYTLPLAGAVSVRGIDDDEADDTVAEAMSDCGGSDLDGDESAMAAQFSEAGEIDPYSAQTGMVWLEPGDEVTLVAVRPAEVFRRDSRRRIVIALPPAPAGQPVPEFSAEIDAEADQPIVAMTSATHGGEVDGLGSSVARLFVPNGRVYDARFLSVDLELGAVAQDTTTRWGNEDRLPIAQR